LPGNDQVEIAVRSSVDKMKAAGKLAGFNEAEDARVSPRIGEVDRPSGQS
jgi:hypothetical protein